MADAIVQTGIGLGGETMLRCDRLRACFGRSRSYVIEQALIGRGLDGLEHKMRAEVQLFDALAQDAGCKDWREYVRRYVEEFGAKTYPPTVRELAEMQAASAPSAPARLPQAVFTPPARRTLRDVL